jgi:4-hydroxy-tetrahydrodipicolinate synthase
MSELPHTVPAIVTPFTKGGLELDPQWIPQHLSYLEKRGADGVLALGTNGEGPSLSQEERKQVIDTVLQARGGLRVFVGTGCPSLSDTIAISRYALEAGADAVMVVPPFFFKRVAPEGLIAYYEAIFRALPREGKVILYNIPSHSRVEIVDELVDALAERYPEQLLGIKDTSGDLEKTRHYIQRYPRLAVFNGMDGNIGEAYRAGAVGAISATANVFPDLLVAVRKAHLEGGDVAAAQSRVNAVRDLLGRYPSHGTVKYLLHVVAGLPRTQVRPPLVDLTPEQAAAVQREVREMGLE